MNHKILYLQTEMLDFNIWGGFYKSICKHIFSARCFLMILHRCLHHPDAVWGPLKSPQRSESCCWAGPWLVLHHPSSLVNTVMWDYYSTSALPNKCAKMCTSCVYCGAKMPPLHEEIRPFRPFNTSNITG